MHLFRRPLLAVAESTVVEALVRRGGLSNGLVRRFVAGEDLETALGAATQIANQGMTTTLDQLGENVTTASEARAAVSSYTRILGRMAGGGLEPNISVKLTMLGLDLGDDLAVSNMIPILDAARSVRGFVRIDMEGSGYIERTMRIFATLHDRFDESVGIVVQSYLHRAEADVRAMIERGARVRLVKGAYAEPATVAFQSRREIDDNYVRLMEILLDSGRYPAIATHDPALIRSARGYVDRMKIPRDRFEFQMLYGVRRDAQADLTAAGYRMRVYVPYGSQWYPYFTRRIAERPANAIFVVRQLASG
ncbi:MAG: proline dehydrogenase family protein [Chloroflexota bacterium]|nr:proline dehydrogenase family protein [Chloroflexota bacterium]